ncbi:SDR family NAD(P)-dependent oxidoreductase [Falsigemmobacter faecalis]|uniref:SDR family NAD(P)-dependent oxidoreductase n=1 Tax=Falsigemmobacter faecalis TaxID=2488730 RepID=A0A3P3DIJ4_9RHOB|nr:SDR family NAD(P)-dependent oxidoreductase [Falsigemmobacter faecalis]RRH73412.1 SDR family NAD(P)-dependent oxidoreductase [Falsigemmobacter faecalis]
MERVILITGSSSGIGYDAAKTMRARGWRVLATARQAQDVARLEAEGFESFLLDIASSDSIARALEEIDLRTGGRLDVLYNNAGFAIPGAVEDLPRGALEEVFATNVFGTHELTRAVIARMRAAGSGRIVTVSSVLGLVPRKWRGAYVASKYALEGLTDVLRLEMRGEPIRVSLIEPGPVTSRFRVNQIPGFERWIDWKGSVRAADYERGLVGRLYLAEGAQKDAFERPAGDVTKALIHAAESLRPKARYFVTTPTWLMAICRRLLPGSALDWVISKG